MNQDLKNYKKEEWSYADYALLKIIVTHSKWWDEILLRERASLNYPLSVLEELGYIRVMSDNGYIIEITDKAKQLFIIEKDISQAIEVIEWFNKLKFRHLGIKTISKCKAQIPAIQQRIKEHDLNTVKNVIYLKFKKWSTDNTMRHHLLSMATLMKASSFEGFVNQIEYYKNKEKIESTRQNKLV